MILLDTHIWVWWVANSLKLPDHYRSLLVAARDSGIGVSIYSYWEVAKLVQNSKLALSLPTLEWLRKALTYPGVRLLPLTPEIVVHSTELPGTFHKDPADQILVATARIHDLLLLTVDEKILAYPHVKLLIPGGA